MRCIRILLLPLILMSSCILTNHTRRLDSKSITSKMVTIEQKAMRDKYFLALLTALGHAQNIYLFWPIIKSFMSDDCLAPASGPLCKGCQDAAHLAAKEFSFTKAVSNFGHNAKQLVTTSQGWWTIGETTLSYVAQLSAMFIMHKTVESLTHPDTLRWYTRSYTPYSLTINEIKKSLEKLQKGSLDSALIQYNEQFIEDSLDRLARYGESICAYMKYKANRLSVDDQPAAKRLIVHFYRYYNRWLQEISECSRPGNARYAEIFCLINEYEAEMPSLLSNFTAIEHETKANKRMVLEKG